MESMFFNWFRLWILVFAISTPEKLMTHQKQSWLMGEFRSSAPGILSDNERKWNGREKEKR